MYQLEFILLKPAISHFPVHPLNTHIYWVYKKDWNILE